MRHIRFFQEQLRNFQITKLVYHRSTQNYRIVVILGMRFFSSYNANKMINLGEPWSHCVANTNANFSNIVNQMRLPFEQTKYIKNKQKKLIFSFHYLKWFELFVFHFHSFSHSFLPSFFCVWFDVTVDDF